MHTIQCVGSETMERERNSVLSSCALRTSRDMGRGKRGLIPELNAIKGPPGFSWFPARSLAGATRVCLHRRSGGRGGGPPTVLTATRGARCLSPLFVQHRIPIILGPFPIMNMMPYFSPSCPLSRHYPEPSIDYDNPCPYLPVTKTITGTPLLPSLAHNPPTRAMLISP
ncbi:hypothetical protein LY76DRAFT_259336 [Colletotrichum caudatum]|nr:hypothetical protein LY76DRAFT_259336 [Colletotrichum caudatum]